MTDRHWDVIVVGTGMGGATLGHALARAGKSVLFCEKGRAAFPDDMALRGDYAEMFDARGRNRPSSPASEAGLAGRDFDAIDDRTADAMRAFVPFIGAGAGGSSALYGMALERFSPTDFTPGAHHPDAHESTVPDRWPIRFTDMEPYYAAAEALYRVSTPDRVTARDPSGEAPRIVPPLSAAAREMSDHLVGKHLHPYRLPLACEFVDGCRGCQGYLCAMSCKNDATRICLQPAVERYGARLLDHCKVTRVVADARSVSGIVCQWGGREHMVRGRKVILAAGALASPALLLASANEHWPEGLANRSGYVGRNLMRHCIDLYAVFVKQRPSIDGNGKEIAFNDFYANDAMKLGSVQSFGPMPPAPMLVDSLRQELKETRGTWAASMFDVASPLVRPVLRAMFSRTLVLASLMEDLPYADNRVSIEATAGGGHRTTIRYRLHAHEQARVAQFRREMKKVLSPYRFLLLKEAENNQRLAHACGTCRFGTDSRDSVLDAHNRAHDVDNLFVVDASFFPSSGGTNPSLTIAANALRVADHLL